MRPEHKRPMETCHGISEYEETPIEGTGPCEHRAGPLGTGAEPSVHCATKSLNPWEELACFPQTHSSLADPSLLWLSCL